MRKYFAIREFSIIFAARISAMDIITKEDADQTDKSDRDSLAVCPVCGQKLFEVESIFHKGVFRHKCRRCKKYIRVAVIGEKD